jgi:ribonuclease HII
MPDFALEDANGRLNGLIVCGIDEAGRGPWAGPVVAAAVVLPREAPQSLLNLIDDSKRLTKACRERAAEAILTHAQYGLGQASVEEIDRINILQATFLAMRRAFAALPIRPDLALIDGNASPGLACPVQTAVGGDRRSVSIAAASIVAKVARDKIMSDFAMTYSTYGWERNFGYGTPAHRQAIQHYGITPLHRRSFRPISESLLVKY